MEKYFEQQWWLKLSPFINSEAFRKIGTTLQQEQKAGRIITPSFDNTFRAFKECPYNNLKVVMLGLDPYPGAGIADGLSFSARNHPLNPPKSLNYILNAIEKDVYDGFNLPLSVQTDLTHWANQGVLLLNTALSTVQGLTGVHLELWQPFTEYVFKTLWKYNTGLVFILLGKNAQEYSKWINPATNYILKASHPASCAYKGQKEWDCEKVFSKTNDLLQYIHGADTKIIW